MKHLKSILIAAFFVVSGFFSVMSWHFSEVAKTRAAWTFWDAMGIISIAAFVGSIVYLYARQNHK